MINDHRSTRDSLASTDALRGNSFSRFFRGLAGIIFMLALLPSVMEAQCPTDIIPTSVGWTQVTQTFYGVVGSCNAVVTYCKRTVSSEDEFYIVSITPDASSCGSTLWSDIIAGVRERLFQLETPGSCSDDADPCSSNNLTTVATVFTATCAQMLDGNHNYECIFCPGAYCAKTCQLCISSHSGINECNCHFDIIGTSSCAYAPQGWPNISVSTTITSINTYPLYWVDQCYYTIPCAN